MTSVCKDPCTLHVVGRTRIGKGEFVATALRIMTGQVFDISKPGLVADTKESCGYNLQLGERVVKLYDTVGYDDTNSAHLDKERLVNILQEMRENPFYPPMVMIGSLGATDANWLRGLRAVFPKITVALRGSKETYKTAIKDLADQKIEVLKVFHLQEYTDVDQGQSRAIYEERVVDALRFYETIEPSRDDLNFDAEFLEGKEAKETIKWEERLERRKSENLVRRTEDRVVKIPHKELVEDGHYEQSLEHADERRGLAGLWDELMNAGGWYRMRARSRWVRDQKEVVATKEEIRRISVVCKKITTKEYTYKREHYKIWRVLPGGMRIFKEKGVGEWKLSDQKEIESQIVPIPDAQKAE